MPKWYAVNIYMADNAKVNFFIRDAISQIAKMLKEEKFITKFFFIRYADPRFHIRLRLLLADHVHTNAVREVLQHVLVDFPDIQPTVHGLFEEKEYEQEIARYGGSQAIRLAESQFFTSSVAVIRSLQESADCSYESMLGYAIKMHFSFVKALGLSSDEAITMCTSLYNGWQPAALHYLQPSHQNAHEKDLERVFTQSYQQQEAMLIEYLHQFSEELNQCNRTSIWTPWMSGNTSVFKSLCQLLQTKRYSEGSGHFQYIINSYLHMNNNRLGILNRDEAFLAFSMRSLFTKHEFPLLRQDAQSIHLS